MYDTIERKIDLAQWFTNLYHSLRNHFFVLPGVSQLDYRSNIMFSQVMHAHNTATCVRVAIIGQFIIASMFV